MLKSIIKWTGVLALVAFTWTASPARAQDSTQDSDTGKELGFYLWLAGIYGTVGFGRVNDVPVSASVSDILKFLDFSMGTYFEYRQPKWIAGADFWFVKLGATREAQLDGTGPD